MVVDEGGVFPDGLFPTRPWRVLSMICIALIIALALSAFDGELDYAIHGPSVHHTLAEAPAHNSPSRRTGNRHRHSPACLFLLQEERAQQTRELANWLESESQSGLWRCNSLEKRVKRAKKMAKKRIFCGRIVCIVEAGGAQEE